MNHTSQAILAVFRKVSLWVVPLVYVIFYIAPILINAKCLIYRQQGNEVAADQYLRVGNIIYRVLGYWTTLTNCISCAILYLVIRHVQKITQNLNSTSSLI